LLVFISGFSLAQKSPDLEKAAQYYGSKRYALGVEYALKAKSTLLGAGKVQSPEYFESLLMLAQCYSGLGDHISSLQYYTQVLNRLAANSGKNTIVYSRMQIVAAMEHASCGNYDKAASMLQKSRETIVAIEGQQCESMVLYYSALASLYAMQNDLDNQLTAAADLVLLSDRIFDVDDPRRSAALQQLGIVCHNLGRYTEAIDNFGKALPMVERISGRNSILYARCLHYLGNAYNHNLDFANAAKCLSTACSIMEKRSPGANATADVLQTLSETYYQTREYHKAYTYLKKALDIYTENLRKYFPYMTTAERQNYWKSTHAAHENLLSILSRGKYDGDMAADAYNSLLVSKGLLLASENRLAQLVANSNNTSVRNTYNSILESRLELDMMQDSGNDTAVRDSIAAAISQHEKYLLSMLSGLGDVCNYMNISWKDVESRLSEKDAAVEFFYSDDRLGALVIRKGMRFPRLIMMDSIDYTNPYSGTGIYQKIWTPLLQYMSRDGVTYFSPAQRIHTMAIEYAPVNDSVLISDIYDIRRVSSTRNIAMAAGKYSSRTAAVYGGIYYNTDVETMEKESQKYDVDRTAAVNRNLDSRLMDLNATYLKGTLKESQNVSSMLDSMSYDTQFLSEYQANEESFKSLSGKDIRIIHIATHGFYINKRTGDAYSQPLANAGLLFSGCNNAGKAPLGIEDGILTAAEISALDLHNTELVVLSACETGLGEISDEGVFGLQRGFKKAGARSLIMSLWPVNDYATQLLMTNLYRNMKNGMPLRDAFIKSQQYLRTRKGVRPEHWAAFIILD